MKKQSIGRGCIVVGVAGSVLAGWWWVSQGAVGVGRSPSSFAPGGSAAVAVGRRAAVGSPATTIVDPATAWVAFPVAGQVTAAAVGFTRALFSVPPGAGTAAVVKRCDHLVTAGFLDELASSPGAPALASVAQPVEITAVSATIDDWSPPGAGVAVSVLLHAGADGPLSFVGLDLHVVAVGRTWLIDGMDL